MFKYPWGDFHSLNLGWFLIQFQEWVEKIEEYLNSSEAGKDSVARSMIAGQYSSLFGYQKYGICRYNDKLWMCNTNLPSGGEAWNPAHWDEITVGAGLTGLRRSAETLDESINDLQDKINNFEIIPDTYGTTVTEDLFHEIANSLGTKTGYFMTTRHYSAGANYGYFGQNYSVHLLFHISQWNNEQYASGFETYASGIMFSENLKQIITFRQYTDTYNEIQIYDEINNLKGSLNTPTTGVVTVPAGKVWTDDTYFTLKKTGGVITLSIYCKLAEGGASSGWVTIGTIPTGFRPTDAIYAIGFNYEGTGITDTHVIRITTAGTIQVIGLENGEFCASNITYQL